MNVANPASPARATHASNPANPAIDSLARLRARLASEGPAWLVAQRAEAWAAFVDAGFPTRRLEAWKSTNLAPLTTLDFAHIAPTAESVENASTIAGVRVERLADVLRAAPDRLAGRLGRLADPKRSALVALSTGCLENGVVVDLARGVRVEEPIRIRFESAGAGATGATASFPRLIVLAGENSDATVVVEFETAATAGPQAPGFTDHVAELMLAPGARIELVAIQSEAAPRVHHSSVHAEVARGARFDSHVLSLSDGLLRSELDVRLIEPGAETAMNGLFLGRGAGHVDHFTTVDHAAPHCTSDQTYRGVLGDHSKGVFRGRVVVRPGAQKTNASQSNPNLLLSDAASVDTRPQLEIYADDVKASHGSTIGQLDAEALFFLRARGIDEAEARLVLTRAFAHTTLDAIRSSSLREEMLRRVDEALGGRA